MYVDYTVVEQYPSEGITVNFDASQTLSDTVLIALSRSFNKRVGSMNIDRTVLAFAGVVIIASLALTQLHHPAWVWLTAFMGANMLQAAFTGFCPLAFILKKSGVKQGAAF